MTLDEMINAVTMVEVGVIALLALWLVFQGFLASRG